MTTRATRSPRRRTVVALAVVLSVLAVFVVRLVDIQVVSASDHVAESIKTGQLGSTQTIRGNRGSIEDEDGTLLASSVTVYDAEVSPMLIMEIENDPKKEPEVPWAEASEKIAAIVGKDGDEIRALVDESLANNPESQFAQIGKGLTTDQYLALRDLKLVYLHQVGREMRTYPNGAVAGNLVGYVDSAGQGKFGIEQMSAKCLAAEDGEETFLKGQDGVIIPGSQRTVEAVDGGTVQLTIDSDLQWYLQQMIAEETQAQGALNGSAFVVEVSTGKIRAAAEYPSMDPNDLDASHPDDRGNRIFTGSFEPGSTFKAITAAAVLENSAATPLTVVEASGRETFPNGAVINDSFQHASFQYTFAGALIDSSNVALSKLGTMVDPQIRYDYLKKFGVGEQTIGFPGEATGSLPADVSKWDNQTLYATTFGQAYTVTVPQVASAYQTIANGGEKIGLSLIESCTMADGTVVTPDAPKHEQIIKPETAADLTRMLENVAVQGGNAKNIVVPGYRVTSKTGTAQVSNGSGGYKAGVYFTSMVGFAPAENPEYVVMVTLNEPTRITSSAATASAFQKAMTQVMKTYRVMPSTVPMDELLPKFE